MRSRPPVVMAAAMLFAGSPTVSSLTSLPFGTSPLEAQIPVVLFGRVHDAVTADPVADAVVVAAEGGGAVRTDARGGFSIELTGNGPYVLHTVRDGYEPTTFELPGSARSGVSTLLLQPVVNLRNAVRLGDRVRVISEPANGEYRVGAVRSDALSLLPASRGESIDVPTVALVGLEVRRGRTISPLEGGFGGAFVGGVMGAVAGAQCLQQHYGCLAGVSVERGVVFGAGIGALVGLLVSRWSPDVWEPVPLRGDLPDGPGVEDDLPMAMPITVVEAPGPEGAVEMRVRNQISSPLTAYALWEGGARVPLGEIRAGGARAFVAPIRSPGVALYVQVLTGTIGGNVGTVPDLALMGGGARPDNTPPGREEYLLVGPGDRFEWTVTTESSGIVADYVRLPAR